MAISQKSLKESLRGEFCTCEKSDPKTIELMMSKTDPPTCKHCNKKIRS